MAMVCALIGALTIVAAVAPAADAAVTLEPLGEGFGEATFVSSIPTDPDRVLVVERPGTIEEIDGTTHRPFLDLSAEVQWANDFTGYEKGLLSIAFAPDYATSHAFYAVFTAEPSGAIELAEFVTDADDKPIPASHRTVLAIPHPSIHHYGGQLQFGPDGYLYLSVGDGSSGVEPDELTAPQDLGSLLGKILRIDPKPNGADAYSIPADNPFVGQPGKRGEIWSYGFRNPWRFSFDRGSGALTIADVGNLATEEVDITTPADGAQAGRGLNFGWPCREGAQVSAFDPGPNSGCPLANGSFVDPRFQYGHQPIEGSSRPACAVMGGYVARDPGLGELRGRYFYADLCTGQIRSFQPGEASASDRLEAVVPDVGGGSGSPDTFGEDSCGRLYVATSIGRIYRIVGPAPSDCTTPPPPAPEDEEEEEEEEEEDTVPTPHPAAERVPNPSPGPSVPPGFAPSPSTVVDLMLVRRPRQAGGSFVLRARVSPCAGRPPGSVVLLRAGREIARRPLGPDCVAKFRLERGGSHLVALAPVAGEFPAARSQPLQVSVTRAGHRRS